VRMLTFPHRVLKALSTIVVAMAVLAVAWAPLAADDPVSTNVTFNREIIRIVQRKCEPCHAAGGLAMSLSDYRDARAWGRAIREELVEHRMPPAILARGYGQYETDPTLNAREMATFLTWLDGGMPRGDESDRPATRVTADPLDDVDSGAGIRLSLPAQTVPAGQDLIVRRVTIGAGAAAGRAVSRVQFRPGNRRLLRGAVVFAADAGSASRNPAYDGTGSGNPDKMRWIGAWLPWQHAAVPPAGYAFDLPPSADLVVDLYYRSADSESIDQSSVDLSFASDAAGGRIDQVTMDASGQGSPSIRARMEVAQPTTVWSIHPMLDSSTTSMELRAERPDKSVEVLLWIPQARAEWPLALVMREPVLLPAGSTLSLVAETDPSTSVPARARVTLSVLR
jgi:hypothetical protein